jgi:hypothetical protein
MKIIIDGRLLKHKCGVSSNNYFKSYENSPFRPKDIRKQKKIMIIYVFLKESMLKLMGFFY